MQELEVGLILDGKVTGITKFGAFVALPGGKSGLVHISEVANAYVSDINEHLTNGQEVKVKIVAISPDGKINLSIKKAVDTPPADNRPNRRNEEKPRLQTAKPAASRPQSTPSPAREVYVPVKSADQNFEDKLKQFMQESDSRMSGNKLYDHPRKSSRRRRD
ncbi:MAG: S1 RNA-binding domain-containing protein [Ruminococcaceae bacterium]|nr:S1 RNA-binding domain-containing protein [Oscillospiraceae bacterium]